MKTVHPIQSFDQIKLLADSRRMDILRLLMDSPALVRHHILALESGDLIEVSEKFYRAKGGAFLLQEIIYPKSKKPAVIFSGSHDLALEEIAERLSKYVSMLSLPGDP